MIDWLLRFFSPRSPDYGEARAGDAATLAAIHAGAFRRGWSEDEFERLLLDASVVAHRAAVGRRVIAFILSRLAADEAEVLSIAVAPRWRRRGVARALLDMHLRRLAGMGIRTLFLEVEEANAAARRLYAGAGFREVGRREGYYPGADGAAASALVLRRDLA